MTTALLDTSTVIVGQSGSGKTVTAKDQVRQLLEERRHVAIIDPTGVWWGMRATPDGRPAGFDLPIFGGEHGDVPIRPDQGAAIARIIVDQQVSAIVDLSAIDNSADWRLFMHDFVAELRKKPKGLFHLVVDEADEFAAERVADDVGFALRENMVWIAKRGRVRGFMPIYITQRTAEIAKAVISQAQTVIVHQLMLPADQKAVDDYLKGHGSADTRKAVMSSLAELAIGERWIYSPRLKILERGMTPALTTFDSSRTPEAGETVIEPRTLAQLDVSAIAAALAPATSADDGIPSDPKEAYAKGSVVGQVLADRDRRVAEMAAQLAESERRRETAEWVAERALTLASRINADVLTLLGLLGYDAGTESETEVEPDVETAPAQRMSAPAAADAPPVAEDRVAAGGASDRETRALAGLAAVFPAGLTEAAWAARTGYSRKGGAWIRRRKRYVDAGLIAFGAKDGRWYATEAGVEAAGEDVPDMPAAGQQLVAWWAARLDRAPGRVLTLLADVHPRALKRDAIAAQIGMSAAGGAFVRAIGAVKAAELVVEKNKSLAVAPALMGDS